MLFSCRIDLDSLGEKEKIIPTLERNIYSRLSLYDWGDKNVTFRVIIRVSTVDCLCYDTAGIRAMYQYIQTIDITSLNFYCLVWYRIYIVVRSLPLYQAL
jgi:hypothetical protein